MNRVLYQIALLFIVVFTSGAVARGADVELRVVYRETGEKRALLTLPSSVTDRTAFIDAVAATLGVEASAVADGVDLRIGSKYRGLHGASHLKQSSDLIFTDTLDLSEFRAPLQKAGIDKIDLTIRLPRSPISSAGDISGGSLVGRIWFDKSIRVEDLGTPWEVRFGWRSGDVGLYVALVLGPLIVYVTRFRSARRRSISQTQCDAAQFRFVQNQIRVLVLFYLLWCGWVWLVVPLQFPGYIWPGLVPHTAFLTWSLLGVVGAALFTWVYGRMHFVAGVEKMLDWTRREFVLQGLASWAEVFMGIQVLASPATQAFNSAAGSMASSSLLVPLLAGILALWGLHYSSRFLGIESRDVESGQWYERFQILAAQAGLRKVPALRQEYFTRGYLARAFMLSRLAGLKMESYRSTCRVDSRLLSACSERELDALLLNDLIRIKKRHEARLGNIKVSHLFLSGVAVMAVFVATLEYDQFGIGSSGSLLMIVSSMILPAIPLSALYWLHHAWAVRRFMKAEDDTVLAMLSSPEAQIRGIFKQAVLCCLHPWPGRWTWLKALLTPMERAQRLNVTSDFNLPLMWEEAHRSALSAENPLPASRIQNLDSALGTGIVLGLLVGLPTLLLGPVVVAVLHQRLFLEPLPVWIVVLAGSFLCAGILFVQTNLFHPVIFHRIRHKLLSDVGSMDQAIYTLPALCRFDPDIDSQQTSAGLLEIRETDVCFYGDTLTWKTPLNCVSAIKLRDSKEVPLPGLEVYIQRNLESEDSFSTVGFEIISDRSLLQCNNKALAVVNRLLQLHPQRQIPEGLLLAKSSPIPTGTRAWLRYLIRSAAKFLVVTFGWVVLCIIVLLLAVAFGMRGGEAAHSPWVAFGIFQGSLGAGKLISWTYGKWMQSKVRR